MSHSRIRSLASTAFVFLACGASQQPLPPRTRADLPTLDGRALYDRPLDQASASIRSFHAGAMSLLHERMPAQPADAAAESQWIHDVALRWIRAHREGMQRLEEQLSAIVAAGPRDSTMAAVLYGTVADDFATQIQSVRPAVSFASNPEAVRVYHDLLVQQTSPILEAARRAFEACARSAQRAGAPLDAWQQPCRERAAALASRIPPSGAPSVLVTPPPATAHNAPLPPECDENEPGVPSPQAPPADPHAPREVVVLGEDDLRVSGPDRERLLEAVSNALASRRLRVVPRAEVEHAERLAGERRWTDGGVVCGQAPPVPAVVARRHHHIVLAYASTRCSTPIDPDTIASRHPRRTGPDECSLAVTFMHAADADADALPPNMEAVVPAQVELAASWIAAAPRLRALPSEESGVLGGLIGTEGEPDPHYFLASGIAANDPWLRVGSTLNERGPAAMRACHDGPNVASFSVRWTIAADGHVTEAAAEPITRDGGDPAAEVRCVVDAVRALAFPCTRSGQPAAATARVCIGQHSRN